MLLRFSKPRSPSRFLSWPMRPLPNPVRSLAYLYSAFSERSPWARATAISLGSSTLSSYSSWSISSCNFCLIFAIGSAMRLHREVLRAGSKARIQKVSRGKDQQSRPRAASSIDAGKLNEQEQSYRAIMPCLSHGDPDLLGDRPAVTANRRQRVSCCFFWLYVDAQIVGRPNRTVLGFERDGLGVGNAKTYLGGVASANLRRGIQHLNGEFAAAQLFDGGLVALTSFFFLLAVYALFVGPVSDVARKQNPYDIDGDHQDRKRGINEGVPKNVFFLSSTAFFPKHEVPLTDREPLPR